MGFCNETLLKNTYFKIIIVRKHGYFVISSFCVIALQNSFTYWFKQMLQSQERLNSLQSKSIMTTTMERTIMSLE